MTKLNISQAAKTFSKDWKTIKRHIVKGKISCEVDGNGRKQIDLSELIRVYGEPKNNALPNAIGQSQDIPEYSLPNAIGIYEEKIGRLEAEITELKEDREERRERERKLTQIIEKQTRLLEYKPEKEEAQPVAPQKAKPLTWLNATLIGCGIVGTGFGVILALMTWVLPHLG